MRKPFCSIFAISFSETCFPLLVLSIINDFLFPSLSHFFPRYQSFSSVQFSYRNKSQKKKKKKKEKMEINLFSRDCSFHVACWAEKKWNHSACNTKKTTWSPPQADRIPQKHFSLPPAPSSLSPPFIFLLHTEKRPKPFQITVIFFSFSTSHLMLWYYSSCLYFAIFLFLITPGKGGKDAMVWIWIWISNFRGDFQESILRNFRVNV